MCSKVIAHTDNSAIPCFKSKKGSKLHLIRLILLLHEFDVEIKEGKGIENQVADHFSRLGEGGDLVKILYLLILFWMRGFLQC